MRNPTLTIIFIYRKGEYIHDTLDSIKKTELDYDDTYELIMKEDNGEGFTKLLNQAISEAKGSYIGRVDNGDIITRKRFATQMRYIRAGEGSICSCYVSTGNNVHRPSLTNKQITKELQRGNNPFVHSSMIFHKNVMISTKGYNDDFKYAQDYELYLRCLEDDSGFMVAPEVLVNKTVNLEGTTVKHRKEQLLFALAAQCMHYGRTGFKYGQVFWILRNVVRLIIPAWVRRVKRCFSLRIKNRNG